MMAFAPRENLGAGVVSELIHRMEAGLYQAGDKLPSSAELCIEFGVSRTVIREALASLRSAGRVAPRQGAGVFVLELPAPSSGILPMSVSDTRSALSILELRMGVELQSSALAARRRTPANLARIAQAHDTFVGLDPADLKAEASADFAFHLAIAEATQNRHFPNVLRAMQPEIDFEIQFKYRQAVASDGTYLAETIAEHADILAAITRADPVAASAAIQRHLGGSLVRYEQQLAEG